ncbi:MAG: tRNA pseudouridine(55) synthase TruB [Raoultibacter sp.]
MKRGTSGLSLVVGIKKPVGMSSHDVVNRCRRIFGEKRVGHAGTLDPLAQGALLICVGPATRLDAYIANHDKRYRFRVTFGISTDTDDAAGEVIRRGEVPPEVFDESFAQTFVGNLVGPQKQMPPVYSAIKVDGQRSYKAARAGTIIDLKPRDIEIYDARLERIISSDEETGPAWDIDVHVSKGTYIRSLARDIGNMIGCPAYVSRLERTQAGSLDLAECVTLEVLEERGINAALDPVRLLGNRFVFADKDIAQAVGNGSVIPLDLVTVYERRRSTALLEMCSCTAGVQISSRPLEAGEVVSVIAENKLVALYEYDKNRKVLKSRCGFAVGVSRGRDS